MSHRGFEPHYGIATVALCAALGSAAVPAFAQDTQGVSRDAAATSQRERGNAQLRAGNVSEAIAAFQQSLELVDSPNTHFDLGRAFFTAGRLASALRQFERARDDATARVQSGQLQYRLTADNAARAAEELGSRVPKLVLRFSQSPPADTEVRLDDERLPATALVAPIPVDPGAVTISVVGPGVRTHSETRHIGPGESPVVVLTIEPVGQITVVVSPPIAGTDVRLDGRRLAPTDVGTPQQVEPGEHQIEVRAPGTQPLITHRTVRVGEIVPVEIQLADGRAVEATSPRSTVPRVVRVDAVSDAGPPAARIAGYATGAVGIAAFATGIALWAYSDSEYNALVMQCPQGCTTPALTSRASTAQTSEAAGVALMIGGGVAVAAGVVLWVITRHHDAREQSPTRAGLSAGPGGLLVRF